MARRRTEEEIVTQFFQMAEYRKAQTVFNIVRGFMKQRAELEDVAVPGPARAKKVRKAKKVNASPVNQDSVTDAA